jgi:hypothetical protein
MSPSSSARTVLYCSASESCSPSCRRSTGASSGRRISRLLRRRGRATGYYPHAQAYRPPQQAEAYVRTRPVRQLSELVPSLHLHAQSTPYMSSVASSIQLRAFSWARSTLCLLVLISCTSLWSSVWSFPGKTYGYVVLSC